MGKKSLLGTIGITDKDNTYYKSSHPSGSTNFRAVDYITCVYDEGRDEVECYADLPFDEIKNSSIGFQGDYGTGSYTNMIHSKIGEDELDRASAVAATSKEIVFIADESSDTIYTYAKNGELLNSFTSANIDTPVDLEWIEGADGFTGTLLILNTGTTNDIAKYTITGSATSSIETYVSNFGSFTSPKGIAVVEAFTNVFVSDNAATPEVFAWNYSTEVANVSKDFGSGTLTSTIGKLHYSSGNNRFYVCNASGTTKIFTFQANNGTYLSSENVISFGFMSEVFCDDETDKLYISNGTTNVLVFDISTPTSPTEITDEAIGVEDNLSSIYLSDQYIYICNDDSSGTDDYVLKTTVGVYPQGLIYPRVRDRINDKVGIFWERKNYGHITFEGDNMIYFEPFTSPPYFLPRSIPLTEITDDSLSYDLKGNVTDYTQPTTKSSTDGSVTITAEGGTSPYTYQIVGSDKRVVTTSQSSSTFSNLASGPYSFMVTDDNNVKFYLPTFYLSYNDALLDGYGPKYRFEWPSLNTNRSFRLDIVQKDYSGSIDTTKELGSSPVILSPRGEGGDIYETIIKAVNMSINLTTDTLFDFIEIAQGSDIEWGARLYEDISSSWVEQFRGIINPRSYNETIGDGGYHSVSVNATDRLPDLKNLNYTTTISPNSSQYSPGYDLFYGGKKNLLQILHFCLRQLNTNNGYRIALNLFETAHNSTSTDEPLIQTKVDTDTYFKDGSSWTLEKVVKAILEPFKAQLFSYGGYWYVVDQELYLDSTINYVQYDETGPESTPSAGSWSPIIDFKATGSSTKFRWIKDGTFTTTDVYGDVVLNLDTQVIDSLTPELKYKNVLVSDDNVVIGLQGWDFIAGNEHLLSILSDDDEPLITSGDFLAVGQASTPTNRLLNTNNILADSDIKIKNRIADSNNSSTRWVHSGKIYTNISNQFRLRLNVDVDGIPKEGDQYIPKDSVPYIRVKWRLRVGDQYYNVGGDSWTTNVVNNESYTTGAFSINSIIDFPPTDFTEKGYTLTVWVPTVWTFDISQGSKTLAKEALEDVVTTSLETGYRYVTRYSTSKSGPTREEYTYQFYELQSDPPAADGSLVVEPDDYYASSNDRRWVRVERVVFDDRGVLGPNIFTDSVFSEMSLEILPNGIEIPDEMQYTSPSIRDNPIALERTLYHFDAVSGDSVNSSFYSNATSIFINHFFTGNDVATYLWSKTAGGAKNAPIQYLYAKWLNRLTQQTRFRVRATGSVDTAAWWINTFRDPNDDNRIYVLQGGGIDITNDTIEGGEWVEVGSDTIPTSSSFTNAFDDDEIG